jgi:predicted Rossmann fold flavoprotein
LFTDYGISGPPILQLSRSAGEELNKGIKPILNIDMFPEYSLEEITEILTRKISSDRNKPLDFAFIGFLNKKIIPVVLKTCGFIEIHKVCGEVSEDEIKCMAKLIKNWELEITGTNPWREAQVTAGGIATRDINPVTMESKIVKGLYLCGEILDIDGDCGGFNLQWAWSSGYLAGLYASKILE